MQIFFHKLLKICDYCIVGIAIIQNIHKICKHRMTEEHWEMRIA